MEINTTIVKIGRILITGILLSCSTIYAKEPVLQTIPLDIEKHAMPSAAVAPSTHEVLSLVVTLENTVEIGDSDLGIRRYVSITGGYFNGKLMSGTVLSGGADWQISPRPILFIHGEKAHSRYFSETAYAAAAQPKELLIIPGANHTDLYDRVNVIPFDKLTAFFSTNLK